MSELKLDERKLNLIKVKVIEIEKNNIINKDPSVALRTSCENLAHNLQKRKSV